jgi:catechol 2,3-dioxygenase-like lactoylglutathione lyase family enzyme
MITRLAHVCLSARDLDATRKFYCEDLGLRKLFDFVRDGKVVGFYFEVGEGNYIEAFQQDVIEPEAQYPIRHFCLEVADMDALRTQLVSRGHDVTDKTLGHDGSWQCWVTDPNGVKIEFHQYTAQSAQHDPHTCHLD